MTLILLLLFFFINVVKLHKCNAVISSTSKVLALIQRSQENVTKTESYQRAAEDFNFKNNRVIRLLKKKFHILENVTYLVSCDELDERVDGQPAPLQFTY